MKSTSVLVLLSMFLMSGEMQAQERNVKSNDEKLADDPTKVITKFGLSYANNYDFNDSNFSISGSFAFDQARKINARVNGDGSEWRIGGSWLFPFSIINFNFGKNEYANGGNQTNYSIGTFMPLSHFGIEPAGFQIFPMAGYTYNDGEAPVCVEGRCSSEDITIEVTPENGFKMVQSKGGSGYLGAFALKPLQAHWTLMTVVNFSYGSENAEGENYKGWFGGVGASFAPNTNHSFSAFTFLMNNNTYLDEADKRLILSYTYQFD
ncbi:hypothetical protein [Thalassotalea mangrovi]|uniref:Transporter n=1 Tax=Thalassotalea mangrovi TaxID=2572245 RepID=A0A4U1B6X0_9GAMM|nr:hypothetical protein [Thalassotalea mangrovi]TKB46317.1 hypothetical protein E8M12_04490 [Thalassotalea mangrovi]